MAWVHNLHAADPNSQIPRVIAISLAFSISALLAVCLRFYVRFNIKRIVGVDDYVALVGSLLTLAYAGVAVLQTRWGQGLSKEYFPQENVVPFSKVQYIGGPIYTLDLLCFKVSLLVSYLRLGGFVKSYRTIIYVAIAACTANQLVFTFVLSFACRPIAKQWDDSLDGSCIQTVKSYYALAGTSIGFDLIIIALPLPVVWKLKLHWKQKVVLVMTFALGFFVTVIQVIRIFSIKSLQTYTDSQAIVIWSVIEVSLGTIIACIPTYGVLFRALASTVSSRRNGEANPSYQLGSTAHASNAKVNSRSKSSTRDMFSAQDQKHGSTKIWSGGVENEYAESEEHILGDR
ncbi:hypothetical protein FQN50_004251 [Emmonsiellopsis sp. PD_5]|nr:hypothetical protein FQN50_004251 [Emmonsiellopsis sp. PD_5]